jgi:hypothetical protein
MIGTLPYSAHATSAAQISAGEITQDFEIRDAVGTLRLALPGQSFPLSATISQLLDLKNHMIDLALAQDSAGDPLALLNALQAQNFGLVR